MSGYPMIIQKNDDESAMIELKREENGVEVMPEEEAMTYQNESNGGIEQAMKAVEGTIRTLEFATEELHGEKLPLNSPVEVLAAKYAGQTLSKAYEYRQSSTTFEIGKGESYKRKLPIFVEGFGYHGGQEAHGVGVLDVRGYRYWADGAFRHVRQGRGRRRRSCYNGETLAEWTSTWWRHVACLGRYTVEAEVW